LFSLGVLIFGEDFDLDVGLLVLWDAEVSKESLFDF